MPRYEHIWFDDEGFKTDQNSQLQIACIMREVIYTGKQGKFYWLERPYYRLDDVLKVYPEFVERKYLVLTAFESGPLRLTHEEFKKGWLQHNNLAIHPYLESASDIPYHEYGEWYVFSKAPLLEEFRIFADNPSFSLRDPEHLITETAPRRDLAGTRYLADVIKERQELFWLQVELKEPETYISASEEKLILVTQNLEFYETIAGY